MKHVRQVNIASYRGLSNIEIGGLADVNVFLGPSNSGKTSALEAMYLASSANEIEDALKRIIRSRGAAGEESVLSLFPHLDAKRELDTTLKFGESDKSDHIRVRVRETDVKDTSLAEIVAQHGSNPGDSYFLDLEVRAQINGARSSFDLLCALGIWQTPPASWSLATSGFPLEVAVKPAYVSPVELTDIGVFDDSYSNAYLRGILPSLLKALRAVYPHLVDIRPVKLIPKESTPSQPVDRWMSYVQLSDGVYPMFAMGDGFKAAMVLLSHALSPALLLLDTPEAFQHVGGLEVLSRSVAEAAGGLGSQVMIATQSLEFLDILLGDCEEREVNMSLVRFEHTDEGIVAFPPLSGQGARDARDLVGADLRR